MTISALFKSAPVTALLLLSFIILFVIQVVSGVDVNSPSVESLLKWGANALPFSMGYEPWRLITSAFLHIGLMHLLFNAFAMYFFGMAAERTFGSAQFLLLFILSAVGGNILNNYFTWWQVIHDNALPGISAGASGGIMGIGMALLITELLKHSVLKLPKTGDKRQLKNLALIMGINLMYGFAVPGIDNAGHIGGAITGAILSIGSLLGLRYSLIQKNSKLKWMPWLFVCIITIVFYVLWLDLHRQLGL